MFSAELEKKIEALLTRYETKRSSIIPILHEIQDEYTYVSDEHVTYLESKYGLPAVQSREILTFYKMYRTEKPAKFDIQFCDNFSCMMLGAKDTVAVIEKRIKAYKEAGQESPFSVQGIPCIGVCDGAPAMLCNKDRHLKVTPENVDEILNKYADPAKTS